MNSKIEVRIEAVKLAINVEGVTSENIVSISDAIYGFILGDAELPENHDANAEMKELMAKMLPTPTVPSTISNPVPDEKESDSEIPEKTAVA